MMTAGYLAASLWATLPNVATLKSSGFTRCCDAVNELANDGRDNTF
jgi:hypothetical protein